MLGLAFIGGLILNVMPCILPVIALKILGFVQQSKEAPARVRRLGVMYAFGVLVSFLVLAGAVIGVQQAGGGASWGMQMQNPFFRLALLGIVTLVALNLFGVFEVTLAGGAMGAAAGLAAKEGGAGAFFNGVLATALATPCTAPFLTVALGFAFTQSPVVIVLMFAATAFGLALPYVLLSWHPAWLRFLPKPGAWMQQFKVAMGFPMLATAVWLFDLCAPTYGDGGVLWLGLLLAVLALAAWVWGEFVQHGTKRRGLAGGVAVALVVFGYAYILEGQLNWRHPAAASAASGVVQNRPGGIAWQPWSVETVNQLRAEGRPVLVDFTARWCLTCKANEKFALDVPSVRAKLKDTGAVALRADYTNPDPRITAELKRHDRAGVPLVLVFPKEAGRPAIVLPATLTPDIVLDALAEAAK
jgi:thiol:disulfide interchange protein DsbD